MARCHRIGQQKPVMVYRLLTTGSVEIDIMAKQVGGPHYLAKDIV